MALWAREGHVEQVALEMPTERGLVPRREGAVRASEGRIGVFVGFHMPIKSVLSHGAIPTNLALKMLGKMEEKVRIKGTFGQPRWARWALDRIFLPSL